MNKKSFNHIEEIIKNAAQDAEPAYDERSWEKMELLLDKDKDRKRPAFFWLRWGLPLVFIITAGTFIFFQNESGLEKNTAGTENKNNNSVMHQTDHLAQNKTTSNQTIGPVSGDLNNEPVNLNEKNGETVIAEKSYSNTDVKSEKGSKNNEPELFSKRKKGDKSKSKSGMFIKGSVPFAETGEDETGQDAIAKLKSKEEKMPVELMNNLIEQQTEFTKSDVLIQITKTDEQDTVNKKELNKITALADSNKAIVSQKKGSPKKKGFYIIAQAGVEGNGVNLLSIQKIASRAGIIIGYQFSNNVSLQTGFFASTKKYVAGPKDYNFKQGTYWNTVKVTEIDANCKVYEIPLLLRYDFNSGKKWNVYSSLGLSSYIMQKEDYEYYYYRYGNPYHANVSYNGNKHFFSVLRIAAGVEYKISNNLSLNVSPGVAIPLAGVGEGTVKLYSSEIMLGLKFNLPKKK